MNITLKHSLKKLKLEMSTLQPSEIMLSWSTKIAKTKTLSLIKIAKAHKLL